MSQRSITSFFKVCPPNKDSTDENTSIEKEVKNTSDENDHKKQRTSNINKSVKKTPKLALKSKLTETKKSSKKLTSKFDGKRKSDALKDNESSSNVSKKSKTNENEKSKEKDDLLSQESEFDISATESPKSTTKSNKNKKGSQKEKSKVANGKIPFKRKRIIQNIDSSDDEIHLPLPQSPKKNSDSESSDKLVLKEDNNEKEKNECFNKEMDIENKTKIVEDSNESIETKNDNEAQFKNNQSAITKETKSPKTKSVHSFFGLKDKKGKNESDKTSDSIKYNPSYSQYDPIEDAIWKRGEKVPYLALAITLKLIEDTSARLKIIEILSNYFRSVIVLSPDDLLPSIYLCLNQLAPAYEGLELGIADTTLMKTIAQCTGRTLSQIKSDVQEAGDLGIVAENSRSNQRMMFQPAHLTVVTVYNKLKEIAKMTGTAAIGKKMDKIQSLFVACRFSEARYLIRSLAGKLRIGLAEQSVLQIEEML